MATQLATIENKAPDPLRQAIEQMAPEFKMALPAHVTPEKFIRVAMTAINGNPELRQADRRSLYGAVTKLAQDGLLADGREAALVIFNTKNKQTQQWEKRVQAMPMIAGLLKLMRQSGEVAWVDAHMVCENDRFVYRPGLDDVPAFEPDWFGDRGKPIGAYAIAKLKSGEVVPPEIMSVDAIERVRGVSRSKDKGPWVDWWEQMALKTVLRRFLKRLPTSADVERAFDRDETMKAQFDGEPALAVEHEPVPRLSRLDAIEHQIADHDATTGELVDDQPAQEAIEEQVEQVEAAIDEPQHEQPAEESQFEKMRRLANEGQPADDDKHPAQAAADQWIAKFAKAETIVDVDRHYRESQPDRAVMPDEIRATVEAAYEQAEKRLKGGK
jgi:recombination protein RecT